MGVIICISQVITLAGKCYVQKKHKSLLYVQ